MAFRPHISHLMHEMCGLSVRRGAKALEMAPKPPPMAPKWRAFGPMRAETGPAASVPGDEMYFYAIQHPNESEECKHLYLFQRRIRDETMERINIPPVTDRCVAISAQIMQKVGKGALYTAGRADKMNDSGGQSAKSREELAVGRGLLRRKRRFLLQKNANWGLQLSGFFCIIPS